MCGKFSFPRQMAEARESPEAGGGEAAAVVPASAVVALPTEGYVMAFNVLEWISVCHISDRVTSANLIVPDRRTSETLTACSVNVELCCVAQHILRSAWASADAAGSFELTALSQALDRFQVSSNLHTILSPSVGPTVGSVPRYGRVRRQTAPAGAPRKRGRRVPAGKDADIEEVKVVKISAADAVAAMGGPGPSATTAPVAPTSAAAAGTPLPRILTRAAKAD